MYKAFTASDWKKLLKLPENYSVSGFLTYGAYDNDKHFDYLFQTLNRLNIKYTSKKFTGFLKNIQEFVIDNKTYWFAVVYGGAILSEYEHLACLFGSNKNIHIGSCGGLYPEINSLDLIIPIYSYGNESTTRIYAREVLDHKHFSDKNLSKSVEQKIDKKIKVYNGPIITAQAMMGETWDDVHSWSKDGFYGVEMETAIVFAVSNHFKVPSSALVYVSDNLIKGQTVGDESHSKEKEVREEIKKEVYKVGILSLIE